MLLLLLFRFVSVNTVDGDDEAAEARREMLSSEVTSADMLFAMRFDTRQVIKFDGFELRGEIRKVERAVCFLDEAKEKCQRWSGIECK